jgi:threonylcarbamoyladenosine tRNA methylthiotransferase MtaB
MQAIATEKRLMPHLHLSLQHGDDLILKRMKRRHLRKDAIAFCEEARKVRPEITFGADIIAGFPTETEEHFQNSVNLIKECELTWLHIFPYSPREGTPAAKMPQVNGNQIKKRAAVLRDLGKKQVKSHLSSQLGKNHNILMENAYMGRTEQFTEVKFDKQQVEGSIVLGKITDANEKQLFATAI